MYRPAHFAAADPAALAALMAVQPLATLVHRHAGALDADPIPLLYDATPSPEAPQGHLRGHVARANPLWRRAAGSAVLAIFHGPQAYVTPSWYPGKAATQRVVPTWNYAVVHAHGRLRAVDDAAWLHALVQRQTDAQEALRAQPWALADAPPDYIAQMLRAIVGIEIALTRLEGKFKLSQNRSEADRQGVRAGLAVEPSPQAAAVARSMAP